MKTIGYLLVSLFLLCSCVQEQSKVVSLTSGQAQGVYADSIYSFKGIPYAKAVRFMPPEQPDIWDTVRIFNTYREICPQAPIPQGNDFIAMREHPAEGEDCLNLNVWTPGINDGKKRPVMVWLHGGGFQTGSAIEQLVYDGANLSRKGDVVVVSVNHRLNMLGFLDLSAYSEKYKYSGNVGTMDMVAALQWIQKNIAVFGGDPNNVTLFGQSGGGAKVLVLMTVPAAQGLFHKAIVQSGAVEACGMTNVTQKTAHRVAELMLDSLGISPQNADKLQTIPYSQLMAAGNKAMAQTAQEESSIDSWGNPGLLWTPVVDGDYLPYQPVIDSIASQAKDIPLLIGSCMTEWTTMPMLGNPDKFAHDNMHTWNKEETMKKLQARFGNRTDSVIAAFTSAYPGRSISEALYIDTMLRLPALKTARLKADQHGDPVYNYLFAWDTPIHGGFAMSYHCSEIPFVFSNTSLSPAASAGGSEVKELEERISKAWINFARTGNPNHEGLPSWPAFTRENGNTMIFGNKCEVRKNFDYKLLSLLRPNYKF